MSSGFLVLSRKIGGALSITLPGGGEIIIRIHDWDGNWAKLAIRAPKECVIKKVEGGYGAFDTPAPKPRGRTSGGESNGGKGAGGV